jgi:hypothetical protein
MKTFFPPAIAKAFIPEWFKESEPLRDEGA